MTARRSFATRTRLASLAIATLVLAAVALATLAASASAAVQWTSNIQYGSTNLPPGGQGAIALAVGNAGDTAAVGGPTVSITLPEGITLSTAPEDYVGGAWACEASGDPQVLTCTNFVAAMLGVGAYQYLNVGSPLYLDFIVDIAADAPEGTFPLVVNITGDGSDATQTHTLRIGSTPLPFGPTPGTFEARFLDAAGNPDTQAGGHPHEASFSFKLNTHFIKTDTNRGAPPEGALKDVVVDLPAGFVGDPSAGPKCDHLGLVTEHRCPAGSQVGVGRISPPNLTGGRKQAFGIYNMVPPGDAPAQFAFYTPIGTIVMTPVLRSDGDWGITTQVKNTTQIEGITLAQVTLWGVPADPSHDALRCAEPNGVANACVGSNEFGEARPGSSDDPSPSSNPVRPFLSNPTRCSGGPLVTAGHFSSWQAPGAYEVDGDADLSDADWVNVETTSPALTGCERLQFNPEIKVTPRNTAPNSPAGLDFELRLPQNDDPDGLATAHLRDAQVVLPKGMVVNASSLHGLEACTSAQIGLTSASPVRFSKLEPSCPAASRIGGVELETSLLEEPLTGDVYLARQTDNPFGSLLAMYMVVRGPGILGKLATRVDADAETGQLTATVVDNPQMPFDVLRLHLKGGPHASLTTPQDCGTHTATARFTSWAGHVVDVSDSFAIDCPGTGAAFDPSFSAGSTRTIAGDFSPFVARITRNGGKDLGRVTMKLPRGMLASLKGVGVCTDAQIASATDAAGLVTRTAGSCPSSSQVGTTTVGAGSGPDPFYPALPGSDHSGRVFLSDPHPGTAFPLPGLRQAAYGLAIEVPAVAGPFDLGTVMVRAALYVDPTTGQLTVVSDRLPRVLRVRSNRAPGAYDGIPLDVRDIQVAVNRDRFSTTPTSCAQLGVAASIRAQDETEALRKAPYQVDGCAGLRYKPTLALRLTWRRQTTTGRHPGVRAVVRQSGLGEAGIKRAEVRLPASLALDPDNAQALCEYEDGIRTDIESRCPKGSVIGRARAISPLLKRPLAGNVFFVKNVRIDKRTGNRIRTLPMLVVALRGEVDINLKGKSSVKGDRLVNTFSSVPDAPISRFSLNLRGGRNGILAVTGSTRGDLNLCSKSQRALASMNAHNGMRRTFGVNVKTPCRRR